MGTGTAFGDRSEGLVGGRPTAALWCLARLAAYGALATLLAGCGARRIRAYSDPSLTPEKAALLRTQCVPLAAKYLTVQRLDGVPIKEGRPVYGSQEIELAPGLHTVEVSYIEGYAHSTSNARVMFEAREGGRYEVQGAQVMKGFWSECAKAAVGGRGQWVAWIVDLRTGEVVGGTKPKESLFTTDVEHGQQAKDAPQINSVGP